MLAVASVDPSFTMTHFAGSTVWRIMDSSVFSMNASSLRAGTTMVTRGRLCGLRSHSGLEMSGILGIPSAALTTRETQASARMMPTIQIIKLIVDGKRQGDEFAAEAS